MQEREFYPMITKTVKSLMELAKDNTERNTIFLILLRYPTDFLRTTIDNPLYQALFLELDRQYARWNKGGNNGK